MFFLTIFHERAMSSPEKEHLNITIIIIIIIYSHSTTHQSFADDQQLRMSAPTDQISELLHSMKSCIGDVKALVTAKMLKHIENETELMLVRYNRPMHLHNLPTSLTIGDDQIPFKLSVLICLHCCSVMLH